LGVAGVARRIAFAADNDLVDGRDTFLFAATPRSTNTVTMVF
jgi:hypothetical protein